MGRASPAGNRPDGSPTSCFAYPQRHQCCRNPAGERPGACPGAGPGLLLLLPARCPRQGHPPAPVAACAALLPPAPASAARAAALTALDAAAAAQPAFPLLSCSCPLPSIPASALLLLQRRSLMRHPRRCASHVLCTCTGAAQRSLPVQLSAPRNGMRCWRCNPALPLPASFTAAASHGGPAGGTDAGPSGAQPCRRSKRCNTAPKRTAQQARC